MQVEQLVCRWIIGREFALAILSLFQLRRQHARFFTVGLLEHVSESFVAQVDASLDWQARGDLLFVQTERLLQQLLLHLLPQLLALVSIEDLRAVMVVIPRLRRLAGLH